MSNFNEAYKIMIENEGGYANVTGDKGGETYKGISRKYHPNFPGWYKVDQAKAANGGTLPRGYIINDPSLDALVKAYYYEKFWRPLQLDKIQNDSVANIIFDFAIHSGYAIREIQKALNSIGFNVAIDNRIGPQTIGAINNADPGKLYNAIKNQRIEYYQSLNQPQFLAGWINRVNKFTEYPQSLNNFLIIVAVLGIIFYFYSKNYV